MKSAVKRLSIGLVATITFSCISAQPGVDNSIFRVDANYRKSGWFVGLGTNKMFAEDKTEFSFLTATDSDPTEYLGNVDGNGKFGLYAEIGGFRIMDHGFFNYLDYGLAYRQEVGNEELATVLMSGTDPALPLDVTGIGEFSQDHARGFFNLNKGIPIMRHTFLLQSIGLDVEYRVINKADYIHNFSILDSLQQNPFNALGPDESISAHLHYKAGIGYKVSSGGWLILSAETPIQTLVPFDGVRSRQTIFNTEYRPVVFSLRYMWLRKRPDRTCAPVKSKKQKLKEKQRRKGGKGVRDGQIH